MGGPPSWFSAEVVRRVDELARFEEFLRAHHWHPESHLDLLRAAFEGGRDASPFLLVIRRGEVPCTMVLGQIVTGSVPWRLGYGTLHASKACILEVLQGGVLGDQSPPCLEFLFAELQAFLRRGGADAVLLRHVPAGSELHAIFARRPGWIWRDRAPRVTRNWQMVVPESYAEFLRGQSKREREDTRRYENRIRKQFGDDVRVEVLGGPGDVDRAVRLVEAIARKTYQRGLGAGFRDTPEARSRWRTAAGQGCLRAYVLWLGGEPAAFCTGFALDSTLWLEHLGFDPVFRRFRPGTHLILRVIADLAEQRQVRRIDFGIGDADYKRRLCHESRDDVSVFVFAPTCKGIWLNGLRSLADGMGRAGQWCLERLGLLSWFKRRWRRALQPKEADPDAE